MTTFFEVKIKGEVDSKTSILATKEDVARAESKIETSKAELIKDAANKGTEMIKWMFVFWAGPCLV